MTPRAWVFHEFWAWEYFVLVFFDRWCSTVENESKNLETTWSLDFCFYRQTQQTQHGGDDKPHENETAKDLDLGVDYNRYLQEVVQVLESDPGWATNTILYCMLIIIFLENCQKGRSMTPHVDGYVLFSFVPLSTSLLSSVVFSEVDETSIFDPPFLLA